MGREGWLSLPAPRDVRRRHRALAKRTGSKPHSTQQHGESIRHGVRTTERVSRPASSFPSPGRTTWPKHTAQNQAATSPRSHRVGGGHPTPRGGDCMHPCVPAPLHRGSPSLLAHPVPPKPNVFPPGSSPFHPWGGLAGRDLPPAGGPARRGRGWQASSSSSSSRSVAMPPRAPMVSPGAGAAARAAGTAQPSASACFPARAAATTIFNKAERGRDP